MNDHAVNNQSGEYEMTTNLSDAMIQHKSGSHSTKHTDPTYLRNLFKDMRETAKLMDKDQIRYMVGTYYQIQQFRKASANINTAYTKLNRSTFLIEWVHDTQKEIEEQIKKMLKAYVENDQTGQWMLSQYGIGEVISAGLLAHIDIEKAPHVSNIYSFAGLNPNAVWEKGQKRPWNAELKTLCWKIGDSFVKFSNRDECFYGKIYRKRKREEVHKNNTGGNAETAQSILTSGRRLSADSKAIYQQGRLTDKHVDMRARRIAVKLFLSHFHDVMTWYTFERRAPDPYAIEHLGHHDLIEVPNAPWADSE